MVVNWYLSCLLSPSLILLTAVYSKGTRYPPHVSFETTLQGGGEGGGGGAMFQELKPYCMRSQSTERLWPLLKLKFGKCWLTSKCCGSSCKKINSGFQFQFQSLQFQFHFQFQFQFQFQNWNWNWAAIPIPELNWPQPCHLPTQYTTHTKSNGSWHQAIKGEMTCTVCVALVWNIIYWMMIIIMIIIIMIMMMIMMMIIMTTTIIVIIMMTMMIRTTTIMIMIIIITATLKMTIMIMIKTAQTPCQSLYKDRRILNTIAWYNWYNRDDVMLILYEMLHMCSIMHTQWRCKFENTKHRCLGMFLHKCDLHCSGKYQY